MDPNFALVVLVGLFSIVVPIVAIVVVYLATRKKSEELADDTITTLKDLSEKKYSNM